MEAALITGNLALQKAEMFSIVQCLTQRSHPPPTSEDGASIVLAQRFKRLGGILSQASDLMIYFLSVIHLKEALRNHDQG